MRSAQSRNRRGRGYSDRRVETRDVKERFLIVCEGEKTEPNYFRSFRVPRLVVEIDIRGLGFNTIALVKETIAIMQEDDYDQVWCVLDRDSFPAQDFNAAIDLARQNRIDVAYSNQAFELWYFLHFHYLTTALTRNDYTERLGKLLGHKYEKNSEAVYDELESRQPDAIQNARRLLEQYSPPRPERDDPSTTAHLLVEQLNRFIS